MLSTVVSAGDITVPTSQSNEEDNMQIISTLKTNKTPTLQIPRGKGDEVDFRNRDGRSVLCQEKTAKRPSL